MKYFLSQQAMLNNRLEVIGYEISFEESFDGVISQAREDDPVPEKAISKLFFSIGIDTVASEKKAFVPFTEKLVSDRIATLFPSQQLGLIFKVPAEFNQSLFNESLSLKQKGYYIILEDYDLNNSDTRFLEAGSILRFPCQELKHLNGEKMTPILQKGVELLATQVETEEEKEKLHDLGIRYFQGDFFSKPKVVAGKEIPRNKVAYLQLMQEILRPGIEFKKIEDIVIKDVSLSYKLLKMVNTAAFGFRREITSIRQALVIIGEKEIKKWVSLVTVNNLGEDKSDELYKKALTRARFCELLAPKVGIASKSTELFLLGMFSLIDAFVDQPLDQILKELPLSAEIKQTLAGEKSKYSDIFSLVIDYEHGDWDKVNSSATAIGIEKEDLPDIHLSTVEWVLQIFE